MEDKDRDKIQDAIQDAQTDFEKNLVYLSAGGLTLSIGFIEKIIDFTKSEYKWMIIISWVFLAVTLILNLASHLISVSNSTKAREETDEGMDIMKLIERIRCRNKQMHYLNWFTYMTFAMGIIFTVIFCSINLK